MEKKSEKPLKKGQYHNDYSPRYKKPYDIYEKAKQHMKGMKRESGRKEASSK